MSSFDFLFLGSGFASTVCAAVLQKMGYRCLLVDPASHPRFAIGESSTPMADQILLDLAQDFDLPLLGQLARWKTARQIPNARVGCKQGFSYFFHQQNAISPTARLLVPASPDLPSADSHWLRSSVDHVLAQHAVQQGATLWSESQVVSLQWDTVTGKWDGQVQSRQGLVPVQARWVIDGSGSPQTLDALLTHTRVTRPLETWSACVYTHLRHRFDWPTIWQQWHEDSTLHTFPAQWAAVHQVVEDGWLWHLAFDDLPPSSTMNEVDPGLVSVGWVLKGPAAQVPDPGHAISWWQDRWKRYPALQFLYQDAKMCFPPRVIPRLQRLVQPAAGPGWLALPNAVGFVDPLHSTGIAHSLVSVQKIVRQLQCDRELTSDFLDSYSARLQREFWVLDQMIAMAYDGIDEPEKWEAAVMVYFAAAITFEEARNDRRQQSDAQTIPDFLIADDPKWLDRVVRARQMLKRKRPPRQGWLPAMADILQGYNNAGLADVEAQGLYRYTTAQK